MEKYKGIVSDSLMLHLCGNSNIDPTDMMRVNIFTMECERLSEELDKELPVEIYITTFCEKIVETHGYLTFSNFCNITREGLEEIGRKVHGIVIL